MKKVLVLFLLSTLCMMSTYADNLTREGKGDGSETNPYLISTSEDLVKLSSDVDNGNDYAGKFFKMTSDIDMSSVENFLSIGNNFKALRPFSGNFDGANFKIKNLNVKREGKRDFGVGLFGYVLRSNIKNVIVESGKIEGPAAVAGIVAMASESKIQNCHTGGDLLVNSTIIGLVGGVVGSFMGVPEGENIKAAKSIIEDCVNEATVSASMKNGLGAAGIISACSEGADGSIVRRCANFGKISASDHVAGIIDNAEKPVIIEDCVNFGELESGNGVCGILHFYLPVDASKSSVSNCYNASEMISATGENYNAIAFPALDKGVLSVKNNYYASDLSQAKSEAGVAMESADMKNDEFVKKLNNGREDGPWRIIEGVANGFPVPCAFTPILSSIDETINTTSEMEIRYYGNMVVVSGVKAGNTISVVDMSGRIVKNAVAANDGEMSIDIETLPKGVYVVGNATCSKKIVK